MTGKLQVHPDSTSIEQEHDQSHHRSAVWRFFHGAHFTMGGLCFIPAGCMLFSQVLKDVTLALTVCGWLYSIGSFFLLIADLQECWSYRTGCLCDDKHDSGAHGFRKLKSRCNRAKVKMNCFASACGSALYLAGSILLIPGFESYALVAQSLLIAGSIVIFLAEMAKLYRGGCSSNDDPFSDRFSCANLLEKKSELRISLSSAFGALFFIVGTVLLMPQYNHDDSSEDRGAIMYLCGGIGFALSGIFLLYAYFGPHKKF